MAKKTRKTGRRGGRKASRGARKGARKATRSKRKVSARKKTGKKPAARKAARRARPRKVSPKAASAVSGTPVPAGETYGESDWKSEEEGMKEPSRTNVETSEEERFRGEKETGSPEESEW